MLKEEGKFVKENLPKIEKQLSTKYRPTNGNVLIPFKDLMKLINQSLRFGFSTGVRKRVLK